MRQFINETGGRPPHTHIRSFDGKRNHTYKVLFSLVFICISVAVYFLLPPNNFSTKETIVIESGVPLGEVAVSLKEKNIIRSVTFFKACIFFLGEDSDVKQGSYSFATPVNSCAVASRFLRGDFGIPLIKITIPEGASNYVIADIVSKKLTQFNKEQFLLKAKNDEGYLFPETYFFPETATEDDIIIALHNEFLRRITLFDQLIFDSKKTLRDVVIMASIIEKEAQTPEDQALVSGILWKRIEMNMPLQIDAPFYYLLGKTSKDITQDDLWLDSPYNTYRRKGLPIGPIGNPGEVALLAAINPKASSYLYYLSDKNGIIHYATTFEEHKKNKLRYLK